MKFVAKQTAWVDLRLVEPGDEFEAADDFQAPWAEPLQAPEKKPEKAKSQAKAKTKAKVEEKPEATEPTKLF